VELWGLLKGLQLAHDHGYQQLIMEGDSQVILSLLAKILNGQHPTASLCVDAGASLSNQEKRKWK
jgi:ribonuclease HI